MVWNSISSLFFSWKPQLIFFLLYIALSLFASKYPKLIGPVCVAHWIIMSIWVVFQNTQACNTKVITIFRDMYLRREMYQFFDGLTFWSLFYCWEEFLKCSAGVYTFLLISKIHPNTDRNPSKVVTFLYVDTMSLM